MDRANSLRQSRPNSRHRHPRNQTRVRRLPQANLRHVDMRCPRLTTKRVSQLRQRQKHRHDPPDVIEQVRADVFESIDRRGVRVRTPRRRAVSTGACVNTPLFRKDDHFPIDRRENLQRLSLEIRGVHLRPGHADYGP